MSNGTWEGMEKLSQSYDFSFFPGIRWISSEEEKKEADRFHKEKEDKKGSCQQGDKPKIIYYLHCGACMIPTQNFICKSSIQENVCLKPLLYVEKRNCMA